MAAPTSNETQELAERLTQFYNNMLASHANPTDPAYYGMLAAPLARLAKLIIADIHQKVDEIDYASTHGLTVNPASTGYDLADAKGNHFELKVSICKSPIKRCNFNWPVPNGASDTLRRAALLTSVAEKVRGGKAIFLIRNGIGHTLKQYELSERFLLGYFARIKIGKCDNHNMGCEWCHQCNTFHRLDAFQTASDAIADDPNAIVVWEKLKRVSCPLNGRKSI